MKKILVFAVMVITLFSCNKQASNKLATKTMSVEELKTSTGIDLIAAWETWYATSRITSNGNAKKPNKSDQVVVALTNTLVFDGTTFTTSDNPKFAGVNNQTLMTSICNWFFWEGQPPQTLTCSNQTGSGMIMAWNTNWQDTVFRSNLVTIP